MDINLEYKRWLQAEFRTLIKVKYSDNLWIRNNIEKRLIALGDEIRDIREGKKPHLGRAVPDRDHLSVSG